MAGGRARGKAQPQPAAPTRDAPVTDESVDDGPALDQEPTEQDDIGSRYRPRLPETGSTADQGAGLILGMLLWAWVGLPFLKGGPKQVKDVLRAKWLNRAPDGSDLP